MLDCPAATVDGFSETLATVAGVMVSVAVTGVARAVAVIMSVSEATTGIVEIVNVVEDAPAGTVTGPLTVAYFALEDSTTTVPAAGAGPVKVTVPVEVFPPTTEAGESETVAGTGGTMVKLAEDCTTPKLAVTVAGVDTETAPVWIAKVADF